MILTPRILGVDPGYGRVGFGIVEKKGPKWVYITHGCIETKQNIDFSSRLEEVSLELEKIIKEFKITLSSVEELFFYKNIKTAIAVGHARGVILLTLKKAKLPVFEFTPLQIKQAMTGYGRADKKQVERMVEVQLGKLPKAYDDAVDALATALTCAASLNYNIKSSK